MEDNLPQTVNDRYWLGAISSWLVSTAKSSSARIRSSIIKSNDEPKPTPLSDSLQLQQLPIIPIMSTFPLALPQIQHPSLSPSSTFISIISSSTSSSSSLLSSIDPRRALLRRMHGPPPHTTTIQYWTDPMSSRSSSSSIRGFEELPNYHVRENMVTPGGDDDKSQILHPIIELFQELELGKHLLVLTVPMTTCLVTLYNSSSSNSLFVRLTALSLSIGFASTWNGILLRGTYPRAAPAIEQIGVAFIFLSFFGLVGSFLPATLSWAPWLCCGLSLLPFAFAFFVKRERGIERQGCEETHIPCV